MGTSLSLSYLGYQSSDVRLFDQSEPFVPEGTTPKDAASGLEEVPAAAGAADAAAPAEGAGDGGLVEIPSAADAGAPAAVPTAAPAADAAASNAAAVPDAGKTDPTHEP